MTKKEILMPMLQNLIDTDFRSGFEDSVLQRCRFALRNAGLNDEANQMWTCYCTGGYLLAFDNDQELLDKYNEADEVSNREGCFVMPSWGTSGT